MAHISDDLYLGNFVAGNWLPDLSSGENPTAEMGVGPAGRVFFLNIVPLALATANIAALQATTASTALTLTAGTGITKGTAPDGSGSTVYQTDCRRCLSLTSASNLSGVNFTITSFDEFGRKQTEKLAGPNANTVNTKKAVSSVLSIVPDATNASTVSVGTADIFGLPFRIDDAGYIVSAKWDNTLAQNAGTLVTADTTSPATSSTGDTRGTYAQSGNASNGSRRLVIGMHLTSTQCGSSPTILALLGVTPA